MEFSGRSVVLTGVGREGQVGEAVARSFAERGARMFLVARQESEAQARSDALVAAGLRSAALAADLTDAAVGGGLPPRVRGATGGRGPSPIPLPGGFAGDGPEAESHPAALGREFSSQASNRQ